MLTNEGRCSRPHVSGNGEVGWVYGIGPNPKYGGDKDLLLVWLRDGTVKEFEPNAPFIQNWGFGDNDSAIVIKSMYGHGPSYFIKYDLASGTEIARIDQHPVSGELPEWARPIDPYVPLGQ